jgi:hypothetical protein
VEGDGEVALLPGDRLDRSAGVELDIDVPADLDQLGRDNSHGTFVRGEGLVELGHHPADGRRLLHQMNEETGISQVQCGLHAGDAGTDYHH